MSSNNKSKYFDTIKDSKSSMTDRMKTTADKKSTSQPAKRSHSEVSNTSTEETSLILIKLDEIESEIKNTVKTNDLKDIVQEMVTETVTKLLLNFKDEIGTNLEKLEDKHKLDIGELRERIDSLELENDALREQLAGKEKSLRKLTETVEQANYASNNAIKMANYNEQYSRKNNIKIYGVIEKEHENTRDVVCKVLKEQGEVQITADDITAVHRIPGRQGSPRPILMHVKNTEIKVRIMRSRSTLKRHDKGVRLADDITKLNAQLLQRLKENEQIEQSWFYNGSVYGKVKHTGQRMRFSIDDDIDKKVKIRK
ncbi:unconventional myosin-Vb [Lingula anatina]|uniref:Unconventional myosin-Vb n=1 Tax=Lingula anatina TaxID=7574 RepID=A0A1S3H413_LINAN|nr:unconventional myosin-Vb [Lingula anatina]|eukprot:XP_013380206.1 unconventional myosin-Vb [Lingula anatina]